MAADVRASTPLLQAAQRAVALGDWPTAARLLQQAACEDAAAGRPREAAHCEQMAASLLRAAGSVADALAAVDRVAQRDPASPAARFAAEAERAQTLQAQGDGDAALQAWRRAWQACAALDLPAWARATVLRSLAGSEARAGECTAAWRHFDEAAALMADEPGAPAWVDVEQAQAARGAAQHGRARELLARPRVQALLPSNAWLRAEVQRTLAECALDEGDAPAARKAGLQAREAALEAVAPLTYFAAAVALSRAADLLQDRTEAYRVLATAWVTLADLLGTEIARSWVEPVLVAFRLQWGDAVFAGVRSEHERERRQALGRID